MLHFFIFFWLPMSFAKKGLRVVYVVISGAVAKFLCAVPHDDVLKYLWDYIIANQLELQCTTVQCQHHVDVRISKAHKQADRRQKHGRAQPFVPAPVPATEAGHPEAPPWLATVSGVLEVPRRSVHLHASARPGHNSMKLTMRSEKVRFVLCCRDRKARCGVNNYALRKEI